MISAQRTDQNILLTLGFTKQVGKRSADNKAKTRKRQDKRSLETILQRKIWSEFKSKLISAAGQPIQIVMPLHWIGSSAPRGHHLNLRSIRIRTDQLLTLQPDPFP